MYPRLWLVLPLLAACKTGSADSDPTTDAVADTDVARDTDAVIDTDAVVDTDVAQDTDVIVVPPGPADQDPAKTLTLHLHGWILNGVNETAAYGPVEGGGPLVEGIETYGGVPHVLDVPDASNAILGTSYYGGPPPADFTVDEAARCDALEGMPRYALITAIRARHALAAAPGATGLALTCHSMGCEVERYLIENDLEGLISDGLIKRWVTFAGVVNGADLATQFGGAAGYLNLLGIDPIDVDHMAYAWVNQEVAVFDHIRTEGNNPNFHGIVIHHLMATKPTFDDAFGLPLLDLNNPRRRPNDGILWTDDEAFTGQAEHARAVTAQGEAVLPTRTYVHAEHFQIRDVEPPWVVGGAAIVGTRRLDVRVTHVRWIDRDEAPSELALQATTRWPYVQATWGKDVIVDERTIGHRVAPVAVIDQDDSVVDMPLHTAIVLDGMTDVQIDLDAIEADVYPWAGVREGGSNTTLGRTTVTLAIANGDTEVVVGPVTLTVHVDVQAL